MRVTAVRSRAAARTWLLLSGLGLGLLLAGLIYASLAGQRKLVREIERDSRALAGDEQLVKLAIDEQLADLERELIRLARLADLKEAVVAGDREKLLEQIRPPLNRLGKGRAGVSRISFYTPNGVAFLRAHAPASFGESVFGHRRLITESATTLRIVKGLEAEEGIPYLWAVTPIYDGGRVVGVLEMGSSLAPVINVVKTITGGEVGILPAPRSASATASSDRTLFAKATARLDLERGLPAPVRQVVKVQGITYAASLIPLKDFSGRDASVLVMLSDVSAVTAAVQRSNVVLVTLSVVGLVIAAALLVVLTRKLDRFYQDLEVRVEERTRELSVLLAIARTIDSSPDLAQTLRGVAQEVGRLLDADTVAAYRAHPDGKTLQLVAGHRFPDELRGNFETFPIPLEGHRFLEEAWESKRPVFSSAAADDPRIDRETFQQLPHASLLFVPLVVQGAAAGGLFAFWWERHRRFAPEELQLVEGVASAAATVMANVLLYGAAQKRAQELAALHEIGTSVVSSLDLAAVLEAIASSGVALIGAQRCAVFELDPRDQRLHARASRGMGPDQPLMPLRLGQGAAGSAALRREPVFSPDVRSQPLPMYDELWDEVGMTLKDVVQRRGYRAIIAVPLISKKTVLGALCIYWDEVHPYCEEEVHLLEALAQQAAIAIENARLYRESQRALGELQVKNTELDSFVYSVSHDLKAPLVAVQGMAGAVLEDCGDQLDEHGRHYLGRLQANVQQMERLIQDLLALSRIGREARAPETLSVAEVVDDIIAEHATQIAERGIKVSVQDVGTLWGIRTQIEQVLGNVIGNAIKYVGDSPAPTVEVGMIDRGAFVECFVKDNGIGIDPAYHQKVFEIFQRLNEVEAEGTGVGLALVKKIVEAAGGCVWVESAKGQGATFRFTWPAAPKGGRG